MSHGIIKHGSTERGKTWENICDSLNSLPDLYFKVTQRSIRDRFKLLTDKFRKRENEEARASGIALEESDFDIAIADIIERFDEAEEEHRKKANEKKNKAEADTAKAFEMRKWSLETFNETATRNELETPKKQRNSGNETIKYLKEKSDMEMKIRQEEFVVKKQAAEVLKNQNLLMQQSLQMMMQTQQQQQQVLLKVVEKLADK